MYAAHFKRVGSLKRSQIISLVSFPVKFDLSSTEFTEGNG